MFLIMGMSFYTTRLVLKYLGVNDFGLFYVIGGMVGMFGILTSALSASISRFLTFEIGKENVENLNRTFSISLTVLLIVVVVFIVIMEPTGLWFIKNKMQISPDRLDSAYWVFQCSMMVFAVNLISVPYNALIIAHEHMKAFAYISLIESTLKLGIVFLLSIHFMDSLKLYALLLAIVAIVIRLIYGRYAANHFPETKFKFYFNRSQFKDLVSFTGWTCIGGSASILNAQGVNVLLNVFFGTAINAARGIATQINYAVMSFATNFMTAVNPQIIKSFALNDVTRTKYLVFQSSRFSFYLMLILIVPLIVESQFILSLWLTVVPSDTVLFVKLILVQTLIDAMCLSLQTLNQASGKVKIYQIVAGGILLLNFPLSWILLKRGLPPQCVFYVGIVISGIGLLGRGIVLKHTINFNVNQFFKDVVFKNILICLASFALPVSMSYLLEFSLNRFLIITFCSILWTVFIIFTFGLHRDERKMLVQKLKKILNNAHFS